ALTRIVPINPFSIPAGHPGATESPTAAPASPNVNSPQAPGVILPKSSTAVDARYEGTVAESTATTVCVPTSNATIPAPPDTFLVLRNALRSLPPFASQTPFVAVHEYSGTDPTGKLVTPLATVQPSEQLTVRL